ncbi:nitrous oxide reductase family maturation protein NosD [Paramagnetospirillum marisnigri]|nr:nitrous oxide reductase family maturation protein NosD [Paramagnetospirillum marisnigri]
MGLTVKNVSNSIVGLVMALAAATAPAAPAPVPPADEPLMDSSLIQALIDMAQPGQEVVPPPGRYKGVKVTRPIILDGKGKVTFDGGGEGSVLWITTNGATVRNLRLINSGVGHPQQDAAIQVRGNDNVIEDNRMEDVLFGIAMERSDRNIVRRNHYLGKPFNMQRRGDGIKLWYSNDNLLTENEFRGGRDIVFWYANGNRFVANRQSGGRYGLHLMKSSDNIAENNQFIDNMTGISMMYDSGDIIRNNYVARAVGAVGTCMSLKESSDVVIENNDLMYCSSGIAIDVAPYEPGTKNRIKGNRIAFNDIAISFLNDWKDSIFTGNLLTGNITEVAIYGGGSAKRNVWEGNRWEDYQGFDRNGDGVGDKSHRVYGYAGRVWMDVPNTKFFKGTPLLEVLDFLDRLAPFSEPVLLLEDKTPRLGTDKTFKAGSNLEPKS